MRRSTTLRTSIFTAPSIRNYQAQRWASYDKKRLSPDELLREIETGLGEDPSGAPLKIDAASKTIKTAAGSLPISPILDPAFLQARRRQTKEVRSGPPQGRFRTKLGNNPYARALSTPIRMCTSTKATLPRYFFQDFELVEHPSTSQGFWAPGPLAFDLVEPSQESGESVEKDAAAEAEDLAQDTHLAEEADVATQPQVDEAADTETLPWRPRRAPVTIYTLGRKSLIKELDDDKRKTSARILGPRHGQATTNSMRQGSWSGDMSAELLRLYRRSAVDALINRATRTDVPKHKFVHPVAGWDDVKDVMLRGCVLWLPKNTETQKSAQYATLDVDGACYGGKMAVHNLHWLFGEEEVERLTAHADVFRDNEILVLTQRRNIRVMKLHMLLWRLQGYLAEL